MLVLSFLPALFSFCKTVVNPPNQPVAQDLLVDQVEIKGEIDFNNSRQSRCICLSKPIRRKARGGGRVSHTTNVSLGLATEGTIS